MFEYLFPAVEGVQSNKPYYIAMIPLSLLNKLFPDSEEIDLPPEFRAQRRLNESRIPEIRDYILNNRDSYVFSALSASIDGSFKFIPSDIPSVGILSISMDATLLINDGQHRKAALLEALSEDLSLSDETISIVFFKDEGLQRSQQMFTDLNKHAVKTSNSLATLYDMRDSLSIVTKNVVRQVPFLKRFTDLEHDILGKNSMHFFTLNSIKKANSKILKSWTCSEEDESFLICFWNSIFSNISEWKDVLNKTMLKKDFRESFILPWNVTMNAFGKLGNHFYNNRELDVDSSLIELDKIDWLRTSKENWENRIIRPNGKIINTEEASTLACARIKQLLGLPLNREEEAKERKLHGELGK